MNRLKVLTGTVPMIREKLSDPNTGLFFQSPRYVYSYL